MKKKIKKFISPNRTNVDYPTLIRIANYYITERTASLRNLSYIFGIGKESMRKIFNQIILLDLLEDLEKEIFLDRLFKLNKTNQREKENIYIELFEAAYRRTDLLNQRSSLLEEIKDLQILQNNIIKEIEDKRSKCLMLESNIISIEEKY